ncbi:unnamed protein product [Pylaiella littoralis]
MCGFAVIAAVVQQCTSQALVRGGRRHPQVKRRYDLGCTEGLCRPVTSFVAKDGGRRATTNGEELGFSEDLYLKCTAEFFRELIGKEQQERLLCQRAAVMEVT